jgi:hypothetical protein
MLPSENSLVEIISNSEPEEEELTAKYDLLRN